MVSFQGCIVLFYSVFGWRSQDQELIASIGKTGPQYEHQSSDENPGGLFYIRDSTAQLYMGMIISHYRDPY